MSRIIKADFVQSPSLHAKSIPFQPFSIAGTDVHEFEHQTLNQTQEESSRILAEANMQALSAIDEAEAKAAQVFKQIDNEKLKWENERVNLQREAYEKAFAQGYEEGREKGFAELHHSVEEARNIVSSTKEALQEHLDRNEKVILQLAMASAEKIMGQALKEDPSSYLSIVKKGLKEVREMKEIKLFIAVEQFALINEKRSELFGLFPPEIQLYLYPEEELEPYQGFIETKNGRIDISLDTQLDEMKQKLKAVLESSR
ncbi:flagellar assembly protein FliH [Jeotgalibacillus proteolyticus]|uniref:Flagellar assembly protein FliH n=1 Tax=Jeotgalibacillus proteolyticus TaxID=2082395 RepID=A0A2S5GGG4_9BACL|nr:flagellar assembly protein FliH [Jeotgalibacillus proteolyticus]PPA72058.1 flagellar assembly protein FliH [Jeotgalibacillus proteolyticus]